MVMPRKQNRYELLNEYGIGYTTKEEKFYFDIEDFDLIKEYCWSMNKQGYLLAKRRDGVNKTIYMHRLLMQNKLEKENKKLQVDHVDCNKANNRKSNLRLVTSQQNRMNRKPMKNNTSGVPGVSYHSQSGLWSASIQYKKKKLYIGAYKDKREAIRARRKVEKRLFGEYAPKVVNE